MTPATATNWFYLTSRAAASLLFLFPRISSSTVVVLLRLYRGRKVLITGAIRFFVRVQLGWDPARRTNYCTVMLAVVSGTFGRTLAWISVDPEAPVTMPGTVATPELSELRFTRYKVLDARRQAAYLPQGASYRT